MTFPIAPFAGQSGIINATATPTTTSAFNKRGAVTFACVTGAASASCINVAFTQAGVATAELGVCIPLGRTLTVDVRQGSYDIEVSTDVGTAVLHWFAAGM
jgi:hypothetical protein